MLPVSMADFTRLSYQNRGLSLSYLDTAPEATDKPVVLLLHGFPDKAEMWSGVMGHLREAGYRCIAPDTVGHGDSAMASSVAAYRMSEVTADFIALLDQLNINKVALVGHDWGAVLAWYLSIYFPQRVSRLVAVSVGHPSSYAHAGLEQKLRGWYTLFFQLRGVTEYLMLRDGPTSLSRLLSLHPEISEVMERMRRPGRFTATLHLYRANMKDLLFKTYPAAQCPVLGIWSQQDAYLTERQMRGSSRFVNAPLKVEVIPGGHWIPLDQPETIARLTTEFLQQDGPSRAEA